MSYIPGKTAKELCLKIIKAHLDCGEGDITSWNWFSYASEKGIVEYVNNKYQHSKLLRAMRAGKYLGWLKASWSGVGLTPWAGSARRQRMYEITKAGKDMCRSPKVTGDVEE